MCARGALISRTQNIRTNFKLHCAFCCIYFITQCFHSTARSGASRRSRTRTRRSRTKSWTPPHTLRATRDTSHRVRCNIHYSSAAIFVQYTVLVGCKRFPLYCFFSSLALVVFLPSLLRTLLAILYTEQYWLRVLKSHRRRYGSVLQMQSIQLCSRHVGRGCHLQLRSYA